jgi:hypothetical protein
MGSQATFMSKVRKFSKNAWIAKMFRNINVQKKRRTACKEEKKASLHRNVLQAIENGLGMHAEANVLAKCCPAGKAWDGEQMQKTAL